MQRARDADRGRHGSSLAARFARATHLAAMLLALGGSGTAMAQATLVINKYLQANSDPDANNLVTVGDTLTFVAQAQNLGHVTLNNIVVNDLKVTPSTTTCASLGYGQVCTLTGTYVVTAADEAAGAISNTASATADEITGARTATLHTAVATRTTAVTINKYLQSNSDPDGNFQVTVGDTLSFLVAVQNSGNQPLTNVVVSDPRLTPSTQTCAVLNTFQSCNLSGTTVVTTGDETAGVLANTGTVTANEIAGPRTATVNTTVVPRTTALAVDKYLQANTDPDANSQVTVGDTLTFLVRAQNDGNQPLHNVVVTDSRLTPSSVTCPTVNRGALCDLIGTTVVNAADETAGRIENTGVADSDETGPRSATVFTAVVPRTQSMALAKYYQGLADADGNNLVTVGDTLNYLVRAQNSGNLPLTNVVVSDPRLTPNSATCATLNRGAICDLVGSLVVAPADETAGTVTNTATATANEVGPRTATVNTAVTARSSQLAINKYHQGTTDADSSGTVTPGDTLTFLVRAQNTGTQPLTNVVVTDSKITPNSTTCPTLNRLAVCDLTGTYVVTAADQSAGGVTNTGTATATEIAGPRTATLSVQVAGGASGMVVNTYQWNNSDPDGNGQVTVGDVITYRVLMVNSGAGPLTNVTVSNATTTPSSLNCPTVNAGGSCDLFGTYTITPADETAGSITVTGSATSTEVPGPIMSTVTTPVVPLSTNLALSTYYWSNADNDGNGLYTVGDVLTFRAYAQNTGNTQLTNVTVSAPLLTPNSLNCPTLNAGGICDLFGTYTITPADETAGEVVMTATATSTQVPGPASGTVQVVVSPRATGMVFNSFYWSLADSDGNNQVTVGDTITYRFYAQNSGNQPLTNVVVNAPSLTPNSLTCPTVNAGGLCDLFATYTVTPADEAAGFISISGSATSTQVPGPLAASIETPVVPRNSALVVNTTYWTNADNDGNGKVTLGDVVTFRVLMQNGGTLPLTNVVVNGPGLTPANLSCPTVNAGGYCDLFGTHTIDATDVANGQFTLAGTATSTELPGPFASTATITVYPSSTGQTFTVSFWTYTDNDANGEVTAGDVATFRATMTNTGSTPFTNVVVSAPALSPASITCATINAGGICDLFATYTVTATDAANGYATVSGSVTSNEEPTPLADDATIVVRSLDPMLGITKSFNGYTDNDANGQVSAGDQVFFLIVGKNIGFSPLTSVSVSDPMTTPNQANCATLTSGDTCTLAGSYTVTAGDQSAGSITNTASAVSTEVTTPVTDTLVTPVATVTTTMSVAKALTANADGDGDSQVSVGDVLTYTVTATNTGTTTLTNVVVSDPLTTPNSATCASVPTAGTCVLTGTYTVTAADATAGSISNTGSATSSEIPTPVTHPITTPVVASTTAMTLAKSVIANADGDGNGQVTAGDVLTYQVTATNTGTVTLNNLSIGDALLTPNTIACATVAAGNACDLIGTYTVTAADAGAGNVTNNASATATEIPTPVTTSLVTPVLAPAFTLSLAKSISANSDPDGNGQVTVGDTLTYHVIATNTGTGALTNVQVSDPLLTPNSLACPSVGVGAVCDFAGTYVVTAADESAGTISNTATATANELGAPVTTTLATPVVALAPAMTIAKAVLANADGDGNGQVTTGDVLTYSIDVTNTGNVFLNAITVSDPLITPSSTSCNLGPTQQCSLIGTYTVTAADTAAGSISNTATATAAQVPTPATTTLVTPVVSTVATALAVVSGDQQVLAVGVASAPMEVELTSGGTPLAGQPIAWTTTGGTLSATSTNTDANGRASVTVTLAVAGTVTVTADFAGTPGYLPSSATFTHNSTIASIPELTPEAEEVAGALDNACVELQSTGSLTPEQQDLLDQCLGLTAAAATDPAAVAEAVEQMLPDVAQTQAQASQAASTAQFDNLNARMGAVRNGSSGNAFAGLSLVGSGGFMPLAGLGTALLQDEPASAPASTDDAGFSRWGFFASGRIGRGESDPGRTTPAYDYDIEGLTAGLDYRWSDNLVVGGALGYTRQDTDLAGREGSLDTRGWSLSGYMTWYRANDWYLDALLSHARNRYEHRRRIVYSLPLPGGDTLDVDQVARASSDGTDWALAATFGRDFHKGGWTMSYYGRALFNRLSFGGFTERVDASAPGAGLALDVESRGFNAASTVLGARFNYAHSADWGVLTPQFDLEWQREHQGDPGSFRAVFASDPTATPIVILAEPTDRSYFRIGAGLSWILRMGRSGFVYYDRTVARDGMEQENLSLGIRIEF